MDIERLLVAKKGAEKLTRTVAPVKLITGALMLAVLVACPVTSGRVPREGNNEVREYLGSPNRSRNPAEVADPDPEVVWKQDAGRGSLGAVAMGERLTVTTSLDRFVTVLNTRDGTPLWRYRGVNPYGTGAVVADGRVFVATEGDPGMLTAINLYNGRRKWQTNVGDVAAPLVWRNNTVYAATQTGAVVAVRADNGKTVWTRTGFPTRSGPLLLGNSVVLSTLTDSLVVLNAATGANVSKTFLGTSTVSPLAAIDDSTAVLTSPGGSVIAVAIPSGTRRWEQKTATPVLGSPVVARDSVFALTSDGVLWMIPVRGGEARSLPTGLQTVCAPAIVQDGVVIATVNGKLVYFSTVTGKAVWTRDVGSELRHPPMILNGQMIVMPINGKVWSYR